MVAEPNAPNNNFFSRNYDITFPRQISDSGETGLQLSLSDIISVTQRVHWTPNCLERRIFHFCPDPGVQCEAFSSWMRHLVPTNTTPTQPFISNGIGNVIVHVSRVEANFLMGSVRRHDNATTDDQ